MIYLGYAEAVAATQIAGLEIVDPAVAVFRKKEHTAEPLAQNRQLKTGTVQPEQMESTQKALTHLQAAEIYANQDQAGLALHSLRQSVSLDPNLGAAHYRIGLLELSLGNQESANYHWNQVLLIAASRMAHSPVAGWNTCTWGQLRIWTERKLRNIRAI